MQAYLLVAVGGALGSMARYATGVYAGRLFGTGFPWGTLIINVLGSFLIGVFAGSFALRWNSPSTQLFLTVGICGGYTTFSTFSLDLVTLINRGESTAAFAYALASVVLALTGLYGGLYVVRAALA